jgi:putative ATP-dependent endonuclease of OLD family
MRLKTLKITNFRSYQDEVVVPISDLTAIIGKNDVGKSTIFEALGVFLDHDGCKIDANDLCRTSPNNEIRIACVFDDLPESLVLDEDAETTLPSEYLVDENGDLELARVWTVTEGRLSAAKLSAVALHPTAADVSDLLSKKNNELKVIAKKLEAQVTNSSSNPELRRAIRAAAKDLKLERREVALDKTLGVKLAGLLPVFALFRADRASTDEDAEVQDPMKLAIKEALAAVANETQTIMNKVRHHALDVAGRTLEKLKDFDANLATELVPDFKSDPNWTGIFKLSLASEDGIPVNKRGSGIRRMILFSFFRAEAERKRGTGSTRQIIYAVEEPETAQHPDAQRKVVAALRALSEQDGCQVLLTTHTPALAELLPVESVRYVKRDNGTSRRVVESGTDEVLREVSEALGVHATPLKVDGPGAKPSVKVLVCLEGPNDVAIFKHLNRAYREHDPHAIDLSTDDRIAVFPLGGSTLLEWVNDRYLKGFNLPEVHIYDRDTMDPAVTPKYQATVDKVRERQDGSWAALTNKLMMECYLHHQAIADAVHALELEIRAEQIAKSGGRVNPPLPQKRVVPPIQDDEKVFDTHLAQFKGIKFPRNFKAWLNRDAAVCMTFNHLQQRSCVDELKVWFEKIAELAEK